MVTKPQLQPHLAAVARPPDADAAEAEIDDPTIHYPSSDGEPMAESEQQYLPLTETVAALRHRFRHRLDVYVIGNLLVYYRMNHTEIRVAPDILVVFGVTSRHPRDSWLIWREGKAPDFVMEIASPGTWERDVGEKRALYAAIGVKEYWRFDPTGKCFTPALVGERLVDGEYRPLPVTEDASGELRGYSPVLGLEFRVEAVLRLRVYDPVTGERLRTLSESEDDRQAEAEARQAEAEARQAAEDARQAAEAALVDSEAARQAAEAENLMLREQLRRLQERR